MMGTKNTTLIVAPGFYQNNATFEKMISANIVINLQTKQNEKCDPNTKRNLTELFMPVIEDIGLLYT